MSIHELTFIYQTLNSTQNENEIISGIVGGYIDYMEALNKILSFLMISEEDLEKYNVVTLYHHDQNGVWIQEDSHHSLEDGTENVQNKNRDTKANRVLISDDFFYLGRSMCAYPEGTESLKYPYVGQKVICNEEVETMWNYLLLTYPDKGLIDDPLFFRNFQRYDGHS